MEGLLIRCRVLVVCSRQFFGFIFRRFYYCVLGRGKRLVFFRMFQLQNFREDQVFFLEGGFGDLICKSQRFMLQVGFIYLVSFGCYYFLSYIVRVLEKFVRVIDQEMRVIGGQKVSMFSFSSVEFWRVINRWDLMGKELLRFRDRYGKEYCLGLIYEEVVIVLVVFQKILFYKQFFFLLYQVTRKFRDEFRFRFGFFRGREFYMKDMYIFDFFLEVVRQIYGLVCDVYSSLFVRLGLSCVKVQVGVGSIGGTMSYEFQLLADVGEDQFVVCFSCSFSVNVEILDLLQINCFVCQGLLTEIKGIEVGYTFYLGIKYFFVFNVQFINVYGKLFLVEMGCYGLGVIRILVVVIEVFFIEDCFRWFGFLVFY